MCYKFLLLVIPSLAAAQQPAFGVDPGAVGAPRFRWRSGWPGKSPRPPFSFVMHEDPSRDAPQRFACATLLDREWSVKWGQEVKAETFASRLAWAAGYFVEPVYYFREGRIRGVRESRAVRPSTSARTAISGMRGSN